MPGSTTGARPRCAIVGTGARAGMSVRALIEDHAGTAELVALCDVNPLRMDVHNRWIVAAGHHPLPTYPAGDLTAMLATERVDALIVTSVELEVVESDHVSPGNAGDLKGAAIAGVDGTPEQGRTSLTLRRFWEPPVELPLLERPRTGHGGADARMTAVLMGAEKDPLDRSATARDGGLALLTGLAANRSMATGGSVRVADLLELTRTE